MTLPDFLKAEEKAMLSLRALYIEHGYHPYKMSKFEDYDLYARNKSFLKGEEILTFTDTDGKLMALKPDVTLSILKNTRYEKGLQKIYYNETVYRTSPTTHGYRELLQTGLECIGDLTDDAVLEVITLAGNSLRLLSGQYLLTISHLGFLKGILSPLNLGEEGEQAILTAMGEKNLPLLTSLCTQYRVPGAIAAGLSSLLTLSGSPKEALSLLTSLSTNPITEQALRELNLLCRALETTGQMDSICLDFSIVSDMKYYSGIVFKGYLPTLSDSVLSGGRYDGLLHQMGRKGGAIGFAVYLDQLERFAEPPKEASKEESRWLNVALPKGRLGEKVYNILKSIGYDCPSIEEENRKLIFENPEKRVRYFWVKPSDVAIYVERGAADIGVAGKDILLEYQPDVFELYDLQMGKCRMCVAGPKEFVDDPSRTLRVATKFSHIAKTYYASLSRDIDIIHLNGSIEIAPLLGLSDVIVDIVETGRTLIENGLEPKADIVPISARLIANKASYQFKSEEIRRLVAALSSRKETCHD